MPDLVPRNQCAEQGAAARDGAAVGNGDFREGDVLGDRAAVARRVALRSGGTASAGQGKARGCGVGEERLRCHGVSAVQLTYKTNYAAARHPLVADRYSLEPIDRLSRGLSEKREA